MKTSLISVEIKLFSSERQYCCCYIALHNAMGNPQHLTGIKIIILYLLPFSTTFWVFVQYSPSPTAEGRKSSCFLRKRFRFSKVLGMRSQTFFPLPALFQGLHFHTAFHCHHTVVTSLLLLAVIMS